MVEEISWRQKAKRFWPDDTNQFHTSLHIPYYLCDFYGVLNVAGLIRLFTDVSMQHWNHEELKMDSDLHWMIYSWDIDIDYWPQRGEKVYLATFPYKIDRFFAYRNFILYDEDGFVMALANTVWLLFDGEKGRTVRIHKDYIPGFTNREALKSGDRPHMKELEHYSFQPLSLSARLSDIDENRHVNNAVLAEWCIDAMAKAAINAGQDQAEALASKQFKRILITYKRQTYFEDQVLIELDQPIENHIYLRQQVAGETTLLFQGEMA